MRSGFSLYCLITSSKDGCCSSCCWNSRSSASCRLKSISSLRLLFLILPADSYRARPNVPKLLRPYFESIFISLFWSRVDWSSCYEMSNFWWSEGLANTSSICFLPWRSHGLFSSLFYMYLSLWFSSYSAPGKLPAISWFNCSLCSSFSLSCSGSCRGTSLDVALAPKVFSLVWLYPNAASSCLLLSSAEMLWSWLSRTLSEYDGWDSSNLTCLGASRDLIRLLPRIPNYGASSTCLSYCCDGLWSCFVNGFFCSKSGASAGRTLPNATFLDPTGPLISFFDNLCLVNLEVGFGRAAADFNWFVIRYGNMNWLLNWIPGAKSMFFGTFSNSIWELSPPNSSIVSVSRATCKSGLT